MKNIQEVKSILNKMANKEGFVRVGPVKAVMEEVLTEYIQSDNQSHSDSLYYQEVADQRRRLIEEKLKEIRKLEDKIKELESDLEYYQDEDRRDYQEHDQAEYETLQSLLDAFADNSEYFEEHSYELAIEFIHKAMRHEL